MKNKYFAIFFWGLYSLPVLLGQDSEEPIIGDPFNPGNKKYQQRVEEFKALLSKEIDPTSRLLLCITRLVEIDRFLMNPKNTSYLNIIYRGTDDRLYSNGEIPEDEREKELYQKSIEENNQKSEESNIRMVLKRVILASMKIDLESISDSHKKYFKSIMQTFESPPN